jgi:hypothetical protein
MNACSPIYLEGPVVLKHEDPIFDELYEDKNLQRAANSCAVNLMMNLDAGTKAIRLYDLLIFEYLKAYLELIKKSDHCEVLRNHEAKDLIIRTLLKEKTKNIR